MGSCLRIPVGFFTLMCVFFFSFCFFRATPTTYGGSQARGPIGAVAADIHHSSRQCWILNPLSETRNRIWFSWILVRLISTMQDALYFAKGTLYWSLLIHVFFFFFFFCVFLGLYLRHMEDPRLVVKSELQPPAYGTATTVIDPSSIYHLQHSSWQPQILNPLARPGIEPISSWMLVGFVTC